MTTRPSPIELLDWIVINGNPEVWVAVHYHGYNLLTWSVLNNRRDMVLRLLRAGFPPNENNFGFGTSALTEAAAAGLSNMVRLLVQEGKASPGGDPLEDESPLHVAARRNQVACARELLALGASVNHPDLFGRTPLDRAETAEMRELLKNAGGTPGQQ